MNHAVVEEMLRARGCNLTPQRHAILRFLDGNLDHPTAAEIFAAVTEVMLAASRTSPVRQLT